MIEHLDLIISKPTFIQNTGKHLISWKELGLTVEISRIRDDAHCEIRVIHESNDGKQLLLTPTSTNLVSSRELSGLAKRLAEQTPNLNAQRWNTLLGHAVHLSLNAQRAGEPVIFLDEIYGRQPPEYLLFPLLVKGTPNIIFADRGSLKSKFAMLVSLILSGHWTENPFGLYVGEARSRVLFLDWENSAEVIAWDKDTLIRGHNLDYVKLAYRHCSRPLADDLPQIQDKIDEVQANVVIIDSLGMAVGDDLNLTKPAFAFYGALRQLPVTPLIIAHTAKDKENRHKTVYGNAFYENEARSIWEASKSQETGSHEAVLTLYNRKSPPFAGLHDPLSYRFVFESDRVRVEPTQASTDRKNESPGREIDIVLAIIGEANKPLMPKDIENLTDPPIPSNNIRQYVHQLRKQGRIKQVEGGYISA